MYGRPAFGKIVKQGCDWGCWNSGRVVVDQGSVKCADEKVVKWGSWASICPGCLVGKMALPMSPPFLFHFLTFLFFFIPFIFLIFTVFYCTCPCFVCFITQNQFLHAYCRREKRLDCKSYAFLTIVNGECIQVLFRLQFLEPVLGYAKE